MLAITVAAELADGTIEERGGPRYLPGMSWTISDLRAQGYGLWIHCEATCNGIRCSHRAQADLEVLAARLGPDHGAMASDLAGRFKCARCGSRATSITVHPPTVRDIRTGALR